MKGKISYIDQNLFFAPGCKHVFSNVKLGILTWGVYGIDSLLQPASSGQSMNCSFSHFRVGFTRESGRWPLDSYLADLSRGFRKRASGKTNQAGDTGFSLLSVRLLELRKKKNWFRPGGWIHKFWRMTFGRLYYLCGYNTAFSIYNQNLNIIPKTILTADCLPVRLNKKK